MMSAAEPLMIRFMKSFYYEDVATAQQKGVVNDINSFQGKEIHKQRPYLCSVHIIRH